MPTVGLTIYQVTRCGLLFYALPNWYVTSGLNNMWGKLVINIPYNNEVALEILTDRVDTVTRCVVADYMFVRSV